MTEPDAPDTALPEDPPPPGLFAGWGGCSTFTLLLFGITNAVLFIARTNEMPHFLQLEVITGQNLAAATWASFSRQGRWPPRWLLAYLTAATCGVLLFLMASPFEAKFLWLAIAFYVSNTTATLLLGAGWQAIRPQMKRSFPYLPKPRFNIKHLLFVMTLCAVLGAVVRNSTRLFLAGAFAYTISSVYFALITTLAGELLVTQRPTRCKVAVVLAIPLTPLLLFVSVFFIAFLYRMTTTGLPQFSAHDLFKVVQGLGLFGLMYALLLGPLLVGLLLPQLDRQEETVAMTTKPVTT